MKRITILLAAALIALGRTFASRTAAVATPPAANKRTANKINKAAKTVTMPLFQGKTADGENIWYVITESSDRADAERRGVNWAPKLKNALGTDAVQQATVRNGIVSFPGTVNFSPIHEVSPGPTGFPPSVAEPGSIGDAKYSPLITTGNGIVLNAEQIANNTGSHDKVVDIDFVTRQVTLQLTEGLQGGKEVLYLSTDSSFEVAAALEESTFAPNLDAAPGVADDDLDTSARTGLVAIVNGPTGVSNPERQRLSSAVLGEGDPLNILQWPAEHNRYSPLWDVHPAVWTDAAIAGGERQRLGSFSEVANEVANGQILSGGAGPGNPDLKGLRAGGFIVNCPIIAEF